MWLAVFMGSVRDDAGLMVNDFRMYLSLLPFQLYTAFKWLTIPFTAFTAFLLIGFLKIGEEMYVCHKTMSS